MPSTEQVIDALRPVEDPELHRSIVDLGMVRNVDISRKGDVERAHRPHGRRLPAAQRDPEPGHRRRPAARRRARRRARLHRDDRPGARGPAHQAARRRRRRRRSHPGARPRRGSQGAVQRARLEDPAAADLVGQGRRRQEQRHRQPRRRARRPGPLGRRGRRRHLRLLDPAHARHRRPRAGRDRSDAGAARGVGRALHLDRLLRAGGPGGHLAWPDAAQGARAVPHRRVLGRARLPADRHAAGHRRHRPQPQPVPAAWRGLRRHHARSPPPRRSPGSARRWPPRSTCR